MISWGVGAGLYVYTEYSFLYTLLNFMDGILKAFTFQKLRNHFLSNVSSVHRLVNLPENVKLFPGEIGPACQKLFDTAGFE